MTNTTQKVDTHAANSDKNKLSLMPLLSLEMKSIGSGYRALNELTRKSQVRILDASPLASGFLILATGSVQDLKETISNVLLPDQGLSSENIIDHELIEQFSKANLDALYSLAQIGLDESLAIVEFSTVTDLLRAAHLLTSTHSLLPIELKIFRSAQGGGYGFFTGKSDKVKVGVAEIQKMISGKKMEGRVEEIHQPSEIFRSYFNLSGQS